MKALKYLLLLIFLVGCSQVNSSDQPFEANIKLRGLYNPDNVDGNKIKADIFENDGDVPYGSVVWIDFTKELEVNYIVEIPSSADIVGVILEPSVEDTTFHFLGWKSPRTINFKRTLNK